MATVSSLVRLTALTRSSIIVSLAAVVAFGMTLTPTGARAEGVKPCISDANQAAKDCKAGCVEASQLAKDTCVNRDHPCVESCRADRDACRAAPVADLNAALAVCNATLAGARATCRSLYADGTPERDACIDQAQVVAFTCRRAARQVAKPLLKVCRSAFKLCVRTNCPPSSSPDPAFVFVCKQEANEVRVDCIAACVEARQLAKDTCLNRDHACVEVCRATRDGCRAPFLATLAADVAVCNTARKMAIQNCLNLYAAGSPERATCINQAQVAAFQCRDTAREGVAADLAACRAAFQTCAQACPPVGP